MEIEFIARSLRRRWWLVVLALLVGAALATTVETEEQAEYRAEALVLVLPDPNVGTLYSGQPDRFLASELVVMRSDSLAETVAASVSGNRLSAGEVRRMAEFEQLPDSNIVSISATTSDPAVAVAVANAYAQNYLDQLVSRTGSSGELLAELDGRVQALRAALAGVNQELTQLATGYILSLNTDDPLSPPNLSLVAPQLETDRELLLSELQQVRSYREQVARAVAESASSSIIEPAADARQLPTESSTLLPVAIVLGALMIGLVAAPLSVQLSDRVADRDAVEAHLGHRIVGHFSRSPRLWRSPWKAAVASTPAHRDVERRLYARIARSGPSAPDAATVVAVVGPTDRAGVTTVCATLARRAAEHGRRAVLVDADGLQPYLGAAQRDHAVGERATLVSSGGEISLVDATSPDGGATLANRLSELHPQADIIIIDGGDVLSSPGSQLACELADAIVLVVPLGRIGEGDLHDVSTVLGEMHERSGSRPLLTVTSRPSRWAAKRIPETALNADGEGALVDDREQRRDDRMPALDDDRSRSDRESDAMGSEGGAR